MPMQDHFRSNAVRGLLRLWVVLTVVWLAVVFLGISQGATMTMMKLLSLATWPPVLLLAGAIGTVWVVQGFKGHPRDGG